jgi:hypothetical protein
MITGEGFLQMVREIQEQGYSEEQAADFAAIIGDMPIFNEQGSLLVVDHATNRVLATLKPLAFFVKPYET